MQWLLLLVCPIMMIFMMSGMSHGGKNKDNVSKEDLDQLKQHNDELSEELKKIKSKLN